MFATCFGAESRYGPQAPLKIEFALCRAEDFANSEAQEELQLERFANLNAWEPNSRACHDPQRGFRGRDRERPRACAFSSAVRTRSRGLDALRFFRPSVGFVSDGQLLWPS